MSDSQERLSKLETTVNDLSKKVDDILKLATIPLDTETLFNNH